MSSSSDTYLYRTEEIAKLLEPIISSRSNLYYIGLPESGVKRTLSESFKLISPNPTFSVIDVSLLSSVEIETQIKSIISASSPNYLLIENLPIYSPAGLEIYNQLEKQRNLYPKNTNYIYHFNTNPYWYGIPESSRLTYYFPLSTLSEYPVLINHFEKRFKINVDPKIINSLYTITGGHPYLTKKIFELNLVNLPQDKIVESISDISLSLINRLHISEVLRLKNIKYQDLEFVNHFQNLGLVDDQQQITSLSFLSAINSYHSNLKLNIDVDNRTISLGDHDLSSFFSSYELDLLFALSDKKFLDRNELISICWGKLASTISDAAVDKLVSRLRQKLSSIGLPESIITTLRGRGFQYLNERSI